MTDHKERLKADLDLINASPETENASDPSFLEGAVLTADRVSEVTPQAPSDQLGSNGSTQSDDQGASQNAEVTLGESLSLRDQLLAQAPPEATMRAEVKEVLLKRQNQLENDVKVYRKNKNYYLSTLAIMHLRDVAKQLEELAKASYELLKNLWLKVRHNFA